VERRTLLTYERSCRLGRRTATLTS